MEVVISLVILLAIVLPMSYLLGSVLQQTGDTKASIAAGLIAEQQLEQAHSVLSAAMTAGASSVCTPNGGTGPDLPCTIPQGNVQVQNFNYNISLYFQWADISGSADVCTSGQIPQVVLAQVTVSWGPTLRSVSQSSVINLPYIATNPLNGFLAVQVNGADGSGSQGVLVTATNSAASYSNSGLTDSEGCAFLTVPAATPGYTVALSPPSGGAVYVDQTNNPAPSRSSQAVSTQGITTVSFNYDEAATVNLKYPSVTGVADGITCPTATFCLATGQQQQTTASGSNQTNGTPTAEILETTDGTNWSPVTVAGMARLSSIACASPNSCEAVGTGTTGSAVAVGVTISGGTWTINTQTLPAGVTVSDLSSVACPAVAACYAVGYGITGSTRTGVMLAWTGGPAWSAVPTSGVDQIQSIACTNVLACVITDNNTTTPVPTPQLQTYSPYLNQFSMPVTLSPAPSTLGQVTCPYNLSVAGSCMVVGTSGGNAVAYASTGLVTGGWAAVSGIPTGASTLGTPICTTATSCLVTDNTPSSSSATILDLTGTTVLGNTTWAATAAPTFPAGIQSLSSLACTATSCVASGQASGSPAQGALITSTTTGGTSWSTTAVPGTTTSTFLSGVGCFATTCVSAGESPTGDLLYGTNAGSWQTDTLPTPGTGVTGLLGAGFSATTGNTTLAPNNFKEVVAAGTTPTPSSANPAVLTPLYPFTSGDTIWPGGCPAESIPSPSTPPLATLTPGGTSSVTAQLASLSLEIVDGSGQPVPGATVKLGVVSPSTMATLKCPVETFAMPTTSADGLSRAGFTYTDPTGSYTLTVVNPLDSKTTTTTITIGASSVVLGSTTYPEPDPVIVAVS